MKKIISLALALSIVFATLSLTSVSSFAENNYSELFSQRREYFKSEYYKDGYNEEDWEVPPRYNLMPGYMEKDPYITSCLPILYTEDAKDFIYTNAKHMEDTSGEGSLAWFESEGLIFSNDEYYVICPQIDEVIEDCFGESMDRPHDIEGKNGSEGFSGGSFLKACIDAFDISKEEFKEALRLCKEAPDSIRSKFPFMSDEDFEDFKNKVNMALKSTPDFVIEALYIEDKAISENLICSPWAFYVKEADWIVTTEQLRGTRYDEGSMSVEDLVQYDLTSEAAGMFIDYYKYILVELGDGGPPKKEDVYAYNSLKDARAKQLAVQTGEEMIFIPLAVVSLAAAVMIINPKRRRRFN